MTASLTREDLFDAHFLDRLRTLALRLRKRRQLMRRGMQSSPATGYTREFKDYRHYTPKEDFRAIDWRLYARLDKLFVRLYEEVQELHIHIVVDTSASMEKPFIEKRRQSLRFAVALAYLGLSGQHRVSLYSMSDTTRQELPPLRGQGNIEKITTAVTKWAYGGVTDLEKCFTDFRPTRQRYGSIFVISDFFGREVGTAVEAVKRAAGWSGETHFVQVIHPWEQRPELDGEVELADVETGERRRFWITKREVKLYAEMFDAFAENLSTACAGRQIDFYTCRSDEPFEDRFLDLLMRGGSLASA
ncbi:DUF58 domain-containing protein [Verrucomicrobium sp. BvORR106]|uniref:DUF58 domain-containing protein n=1 Tax=Verrucomicrobium sp. BvORR106 TaxID=1403819 RepID=UPI0005700226|nr:DUF58 domain-containing protein [Verrucomicrobium sp. BvORR106]